MDTADCYRRLELNLGASLDEVKASYRRLARQYHPDTNPGNQQAHHKFIEVTEAYKFLLVAVKSNSSTAAYQAKPADGAAQATWMSVHKTGAAGEAKPKAQSVTIRTRTQVAYRENPIPNSPAGIKEQQLKRVAYKQLQQLLKRQQFLQAIPLVEGLAHRLPEDPEVRQWQAITYQGWGRHLIGMKQLDKARAYLKKALRTDPHNKALWAEVERDFRHIEQIF
ncbi:MAG TPA: J domain-containing protein [Candidatus Caenarcaniphilales bacterium]